MARLGDANPTAAILGAALLLDFLDENAAGARLRTACAEPVTGSTSQIGDAIATRLAS